MVRTFIALELSDEIRGRIRKSQEILLGCRAHLTPVSPEIAHITIKFLGEIPPEKVQKVIEALRGVRGPAFEFTVSGVGCNSRSRPRVVWGLVKDHGECENIARQVEDVLEPLGIPREERRFHPHITLARVKRFDPSLFAKLRELESTDLGSARVGCLKVMKSTLTPSGPRYEDLAEVVL